MDCCVVPQLLCIHTTLGLNFVDRSFVITYSSLQCTSLKCHISWIVF